MSGADLLAPGWNNIWIPGAEAGRQVWRRFGDFLFVKRFRFGSFGKYLIFSRMHLFGNKFGGGISLLQLSLGGHKSAFAFSQTLVVW